MDRFRRWIRSWSAPPPPTQSAPSTQPQLRYVAAVQAFLQAADEMAARQVFAACHVVLQPYEAQVWLDRLVAAATEEERPHLSERTVLLRTLRGVAPVAPVHPMLLPASTPSPPALAIAGDLLQAGQNIYINSAHVPGSGSAVVINNIVVERRWQRPTPPTLIRTAIPRTDDLQKVTQLLADRGQVAIRGPTIAAVQGMPGVGKTTLARQLALDLDTHYPDGVIWQEIGPQISADQVHRILNQWAQVALLLPRSLDANLQFDPGAVRALFRDRRLLVILDDVWSLDVIRPLRDALPEGAHLILTTRLETVTVGLGGEQHVLGTLTPEEAQALIALRLGWPDIPYDHQAWCDVLAQGVGYHTLALDVALGILRLKGHRPEAWHRIAVQLVEALRTGQGFNDLQIPDGDREHHVERVLAYSYERMDAVAQERFRLLGAMAEGASWATEHIAQLWQCDEPTALDQMDALVNAALLSRAEQHDDRWQQHNLLRGYALALLRRAGAAEAARAQHAAIYAAAMQQADDAQHHHTMLPDYPQVRHAVVWAIANDLARAQNLINNTANLQAAFGFAHEGLAWSLQALNEAQQRGTSMNLAIAQITVGTALQRVASLAGEDRGVRLREALAAHEAALEWDRLNTAPFAFAIIQTNRGNVLRDLASVAGEDRAARLRAALATYDAALVYQYPDTAPLAYASIQNNRGVILSDLANLSGEERGSHLRAALAAYNAALAYRRPETAPLAYAATENNRAAVLCGLASLPGEDHAVRLREALAAYDAALVFSRPDTAPLAFAMTQTNRGAVLSELASLPGEERGARLREALAAYDEALVYRRPDTVPLAYASTQNNRGIVLRELASLLGEGRATRLRESLAAYDEALLYRRSDSVPLDFASTQNNRGVVLNELANLLGEDREARLREALAAYDVALVYRRADTAPFDFAMTQNNRGVVLNKLANLPGEERGARLREALAAYDAALAFYRTDTAPFDFAMTQNNRGMVLNELASLPEENRAARLHEALAAYDAALAFYRTDTAPLDFVMTQNNRGVVLNELASLSGEDRGVRLHEALAAYDAVLAFYRTDTAPLDFAMTQGNRALLFFQMADLPGEQSHDHRCDALRALWTAFMTFTNLGHESYQQWAAGHLRWQLLVSSHNFLRAWEGLDLGTLPSWLVPRADPPITNTPLLDAFLAESTPEGLNTFWQQVPREEEDPFLNLVAQAITQAEHGGNSALAAQLSEHLAALNRLRTAQE